jgi:hypothetical protein
LGYLRRLISGRDGTARIEFSSLIHCNSNCYAITRRLDVGGAILSSSLFGMPVTPVFDDHTGGWSRQTRDVSFLSFSVFARFGL